MRNLFSGRSMTKGISKIGDSPAGSTASNSAPFRRDRLSRRDRWKDRDIKIQPFGHLQKNNSHRAITINTLAGKLGDSDLSDMFGEGEGKHV